MPSAPCRHHFDASPRRTGSGVHLYPSLEPALTRQGHHLRQEVVAGVEPLLQTGVVGQEPARVAGHGPVDVPQHRVEPELLPAREVEDHLGVLLRRQQRGPVAEESRVVVVQQPARARHAVLVLFFQVHSSIRSLSAAVTVLPGDPPGVLPIIRNLQVPTGSAWTSPLSVPSTVKSFGRLHNPFHQRRPAVGRPSRYRGGLFRTMASARRHMGFVH